MPSFVKGGSVTTPFGRNEYVRSTRSSLSFESYTLAAASLSAQTIDGVAGQKILQPGTVLAKITSGPDAGKVGPYQGAGTSEVQTLTESGAITGGTYTITYSGQTTTALAYNATAATVELALEALSNVGTDGITVTGGPVDTTPLTLTFKISGGNVDEVTVNTASLTGTTPGITVATTTPGTAGANDGRQTVANIVGINDTFLPWQLIERDVEVGVLQTGKVVQAWCFEYNAAGVAVALTNTTAGDAVWNGKLLSVKFS